MQSASSLKVCVAVALKWVLLFEKRMETNLLTKCSQAAEVGI